MNQEKNLHKYLDYKKILHDTKYSDSVTHYLVQAGEIVKSIISNSTIFERNSRGPYENFKLCCFNKQMEP